MMVDEGPRRRPNICRQTSAGHTFVWQSSDAGIAAACRRALAFGSQDVGEVQALYPDTFLTVQWASGFNAA